MIDNPQPRDDSLMERYRLPALRRMRARDAVVVVVTAALLLVAFEGTAIRKAGLQMAPGIGRNVVLAVGRPAAAVSEGLALNGATHTLTAWLSPEPNLSGGTFEPASYSATATAVPAVTPEQFDPAAIGQPAPPRRPLHTVLVTGDSMSMPLDEDLARDLDPTGVNVVQDPHLGTGISTTFIVNWGKLAAYQVAHDHPNAVVMFIGANDGFPMPGAGGREVPCCGTEWAAIYANRARQMMNTYRQAGAARVYWITLPTPREEARREIARVVNAAIKVAAQPWADQVRVIDSVPIFTPGEIYRDSMDVEGKATIVRESDGIHLNEAGSELLAKLVLADIGQDFTL
jgi:hypothetical protein